MKSFVLAVTLAAAPLLAMPQGALADQLQGMQMGHSSAMSMPAGTVPKQGGQAAFAAIHEIVGILMADPHTDWSKVNIEALRQHLIDMNNVTMKARVVKQDLPDGARFEVTGDGATVGSIRRMTRAHAAMMNGSDGWIYAAEEIPGGAEMTVTAKTADDAVKIQGLGYIGLMALGSHHQMHHLMFAEGKNPLK